MAERGNYSEIAYNVVSGNHAVSYEYVRDGSAVEVFGSSYTNVHHNRSYNNNTFAGLGDDSFSLEPTTTMEDSNQVGEG